MVHGIGKKTNKQKIRETSFLTFTWDSNVQLNENKKKSKLLGGDSLLGVNKTESEMADIKAQK